MQPMEESISPRKRKFRRLHRLRCGVARSEYDGYEDVREACERKLREWERQGVIPVQYGFKGNDWLFGGQAR